MSLDEKIASTIAVLKQAARRFFAGVFLPTVWARKTWC